MMGVSSRNNISRHKHSTAATPCIMPGFLWWRVHRWRWWGDTSKQQEQAQHQQERRRSCAACRVPWTSRNAVSYVPSSITTPTIKEHQHPCVRTCYCHHHHYHHTCVLCCIVFYSVFFLIIFPLFSISTTTTRIPTNWFGSDRIELYCIVVVGMTTSW